MVSLTQNLLKVLVYTLNTEFVFLVMSPIFRYIERVVDNVFDRVQLILVVYYALDLLARIRTEIRAAQQGADFFRWIRFRLLVNIAHGKGPQRRVNRLDDRCADPRCDRLACRRAGHLVVLRANRRANRRASPRAILRATLLFCNQRT